MGDCLGEGTPVARTAISNVPLIGRIEDQRELERLANDDIYYWNILLQR